MTATITLLEFARLVRQALRALYDYPALQVLPLADLLVGDLPASLRGAALHRVLIAAIEALKPAATDPANRAWRRYQYLYLRYIDVRGIVDISTALGVSFRQARRDHHEAIALLASRLYETYRAGSGLANQKPPLVSAEPDLASEAERLTAIASTARVRCDEAIASTIDTLAPFALARGVALRHLPASEPVSTLINRTLLRQALICAVKYVLALGATSSVTIGTSRLPKAAQIHIRANLADRLPERAEAELHLATCRQLLGPTRGTVRAGQDADTAWLELLLPTDPSATILLVDDNADVRALFRRYLADWPYRILEAEGFGPALELTRLNRPDLLILDVMLPERDGWELLQRLRQDLTCAQIPVIVCSVLRDRDLAFTLGAADFLEKPVSPVTLLRAVDQQLRRPPGQPRRVHSSGSAGSPAASGQRPG